jgi:hypothetical protein
MLSPMKYELGFFIPEDCFCYFCVSVEIRDF